MCSSDLTSVISMLGRISAPISASPIPRVSSSACCPSAVAPPWLPIAGTTKGDPLEAARIAGVFGVKRTPDLLPFCHPIAVTGAELTVTPDRAAGTVTVVAKVRAKDRTGVEMEALTAAAVAALSLYDTSKAFDRSARIGGLRLLEKRGGKSGDYVADRA